MGTADNIEFHSFSFGDMHPNNANVWPTKEQDSVFRFNTLWLEMSQDQISIERETYSLLDLLSSIGGLFDGLLLLMRYLMAPVSSFIMRNALYSKLMREGEKVNRNCSRKHRRAIDKAESNILAMLDLKTFLE